MAINFLSQILVSVFGKKIRKYDFVESQNV